MFEKVKCDTKCHDSTNYKNMFDWFHVNSKIIVLILGSINQGNYTYHNKGSKYFSHYAC